MIFYTFSIFYIYFLIYAKKLPLFILFFLFLPIILFATFRGSSGIDSYLYLYRFDVFDYQNLFISIESEPFLDFLIYISKYVLSGSHHIFFLLHALIVCFLFALIVKKYSDARAYLVTVGPVILIDGLTNGMRITLAYHLFAVSMLYGKKLFMPVLVVLSHVSGLFMYIFAGALNFKNLSFRYKIILFFFLFLVVSIAYLYLYEISLYVPRLSGKIVKYSTLISHSSFAGLVDIFVIASVLILGAWSNAKNKSELIWGILLSIIVSLFFLILFQYSIAFIRLGKLFIVALCLSGYVNNSKKKIPINILVFVGTIYTLNFLRAVYFVDGFLPYPGNVS
jgi:hypothetical protein